MCARHGKVGDDSHYLIVMPLPRIHALNGHPLVLNANVAVDIPCGIARVLKCVMDWIVPYCTEHFLTMCVKMHVILCDHGWVHAFDTCTLILYIMLFMPKLVCCT